MQGRRVAAPDPAESSPCPPGWRVGSAEVGEMRGKKGAGKGGERRGRGEWRERGGREGRGERCRAKKSPGPRGPLPARHGRKGGRKKHGARSRGDTAMAGSAGRQRPGTHGGVCSGRAADGGEGGDGPRVSGPSIHGVGYQDPGQGWGSRHHRPPGGLTRRPLPP